MLDAWRIDESILSACDSDFSLDINWDGCLFIASKRVHVSVLCSTFGVMQFFHFEQYSTITKRSKLLPTYAC